MALNTFAALCVMMYYVGITSLGVWSARKLHSFQRSSRRSSRLSSRAQDEAESFLVRYFLCDRHMPLLLGFTSMTATWVGGGYLNGTAEAVYRLGLIHCQAPFGYAVSLLLGGAFFVAKLHESGSTTMLDPFQRRYGKWISLMLMPPAICGEVFWTAAVLSALGSTVQVIVKLDAGMAIIISAVVTFFYTAFGGLYSVTHTDTFQAVCICIGLWACVPFCLRSSAVGKVPAPDGDWTGQIEFSNTGRLLDEFATTALGGIPWQVYFQRTLACRSVFEAKLMSYLAAFGCIFLAIPPVILGAAARTANLTALGYAGSHRLRGDDISAVLPFAMRFLAPSFVSILGLGAITSAVMSSADSSVLSASSLITKNFYYKILRPTASVAEIATVARAIVCMVGTATTTMALSVQSVYTLWSLSADVVYVMLFPQLLCLFYLDKMTNTYGLMCGVIVGLVTRVLCGEPSLNLPVVLKLPFYDEDVGQRFPHRTLCMSLNMATTVLGSALCERLFHLGYLRKHLDYCRCFEKMTVLERGDTVKEETKSMNNARPLSSRADTKTINASKATPTNYPFPYPASLKKTDTQDNDPMTEVPQTADPFGTDASRFEELRLAGSFSSSRASSRAPSRTASFIATAAPGLSGKQVREAALRLFRPGESSIRYRSLSKEMGCEINDTP